MALRATVHPTSEAGDQLFELTLEKTDGDKGTISVKSWSRDQNPETDDPVDDQSVELYDIRSITPLQITCKGNVFGPDPNIICGLYYQDPPARSFVQVDVSGAIARNGTTKYSVSRPDFDILRQFLTDAAFPGG